MNVDPTFSLDCPALPMRITFSFPSFGAKSICATSASRSVCRDRRSTVCAGLHDNSPTSCPDLDCSPLASTNPGLDPRAPLARPFDVRPLTKISIHLCQDSLGTVFWDDGVSFIIATIGPAIARRNAQNNRLLGYAARPLGRVACERSEQHALNIVVAGNRFLLGEEKKVVAYSILVFSYSILNAILFLVPTFLGGYLFTFVGVGLNVCGGEASTPVGEWASTPVECFSKESLWHARARGSKS